MPNHIIRNAQIVNEGKIYSADVLIKDSRIEKIAPQITTKSQVNETDAAGNFMLPGLIDEQVHFREPGLTHKASIYTESKAAVAGGVTSFMEMPNTKPAALTQALLEQKYQIAQTTSLANYSFYMGTSNENYEDVMQTDLANVCGLKIFMGSSTGNMLVDDEKVLRQIFANFPGLISTHCESESVIKSNLEKALAKYGTEIPVTEHPIIRSREACLASSTQAVNLAKEFGTRLNVFHISTADEIALFKPQTTIGPDANCDQVLRALSQKRITAEICVHHLTFNSDQYKTLGNQIKCNPAIKEESDRAALFQAMLNNQLDIIATDHAPHTAEEKANPDYTQSPSGLPLIQHSLQMMLQFYHQKLISLEKIVEKICHAPAVAFKVKNRGFIREGYQADLVLVDTNQNETVSKSNILYKCGWSPLEGQIMKSKVLSTWVNGHMVYNLGNFDECMNGMRLEFDSH